jgi:DNA-binding response OmpR family regulator
MVVTTAPCPVLVVEDDSSIAQMVTRVVNRAAWPVHSVGTAAEALKQISEHDYTAIVLDLMLPNGSGRDVIEVLRRDRPELLRRVIVMTASPSLLKSIQPDEVAGTLTKPFDIHHLTDLLGKASRMQDSSNC